MACRVSYMRENGYRAVKLPENSDSKHKKACNIRIRRVIFLIESWKNISIFMLFNRRLHPLDRIRGWIWFCKSFIRGDIELSLEAAIGRPAYS